MAYCTVEQVRERLPLITADVRDDDSVAGFIAQAEAVVDGKLASRFQLPLPEEETSLIHFICLDLVCGLLLENVYGSDVPVVSELAGVLQNRAQELLQQLVQGRILLPGADSREDNPLGVERRSLEQEERQGSQFYTLEEILLPESED
jgi:phage gp36-like protein